MTSSDSTKYLYISNTSSFVVKTCFQPNFLSSLHQFFGTYSKLLPCKNIMTTFKPLQFAFKGYIIKLFLTKTWSVGTYYFFLQKGLQLNSTLPCNFDHHIFVNDKVRRRSSKVWFLQDNDGNFLTGRVP